MTEVESGCGNRSYFFGAPKSSFRAESSLVVHVCLLASRLDPSTLRRKGIHP